jgi:hypothetical protein
MTLGWFAPHARLRSLFPGYAHVQHLLPRATASDRIVWMVVFLLLQDEEHLRPHQ